MLIWVEIIVLYMTQEKDWKRSKKCHVDSLAFIWNIWVSEQSFPETRVMMPGNIYISVESLYFDSWCISSQNRLVKIMRGK